jgi:hypothetical protein
MFVKIEIVKDSIECFGRRAVVKSCFWRKVNLRYMGG